MAAEASVAPLVVEYCPVTGVPAEFNDFLPKDSDEYKKWKAFTEGQLEGKTAELSLKDAQTTVAEKKQSGGKAKKKAAQEVLITRAVRNKKKCVTTVAGLEHFGVKLSEAAKVFGKKFASGASVTKTATGGEEIDIQGDVLDALPDLLLKTYGAKNAMEKKHIFTLDEKKKKVPVYEDDESEDDE